MTGLVKCCHSTSASEERLDWEGYAREYFVRVYVAVDVVESDIV